MYASNDLTFLHVARTRTVDFKMIFEMFEICQFSKFHIPQSFKFSSLEYQNSNAI